MTSDSRKKTRPTDAELGILRVLWQRGDSTVREVQEELEKVSPTGYTTVLKLLQIMTEKGLVARDESRRAHVYRAADAPQTVQRGLVADLLDRAFGGSARQLVQQALASRPASSGELAEIRQLLDDMESADVESADVESADVESADVESADVESDDIRVDDGHPKDPAGDVR